MPIIRPSRHIVKPLPGTPLAKGHPVNDGLVACYAMNEGGGAKVLNASGHGWNLTLANGASFATGLIGSCTTYDGADDYAANFGDMPFSGGLTDITIGFWAKQNGGANQKCWLILSGVNSYKNWIRLRCGGSTYPGQLFYDESNDAGQSLIYPSNGTINFLNDGNWHHIWITRNKSADEVKCYIDGVWYWTLNSLVDMTNASMTNLGLAALVYGSSSVQDYMPCDIDIVSIYDRALTPSEIASLYADPWQGFRRGAAYPRVVSVATGTVSLAGVIVADSAASGSVSVARALSSTVAAQSAITGGLSVVRSVTGALVAESTTSGALSVARGVAGSAAAQASLSGALSLTRNVSGSVQSQSATSGDLSVARDIAGTVAGESSVSGGLSVARPVAGDVTAQSGTSATLSVTRTVSGSVAGQSDVSGSIQVARPLSGSIAAESGATGSLSLQGSVVLAGAVAAQSDVTGAMSVSRTLSGATVAESAMSGALSVSRSLSGAIAAESGFVGDLTVQRATVALAGSVTAQAQTAGALSRSLQLSGQCDAVAVVSGAVTCDFSLAGSIGATSELSGVLSLPATVAVAAFFMLKKAR